MFSSAWDVFSRNTRSIPPESGGMATIHPGYYLVTTDHPDRWLLIALTHTGGMHLLFDGAGDEACSLRDTLLCRESEVRTPREHGGPRQWPTGYSLGK